MTLCEHKAILATKPGAITLSNNLLQRSIADDSTHFILLFLRWHMVNEAIVYASWKVANGSIDVESVLVNPLPCMDKHKATIGRVPVSILDILQSLAY